MLKPILIHPDPRLKKVCDPVPDISDQIRTLANDMLETMYHAPGIGLAAPQIGVNARILVMDCSKRDGDGGKPEPLVLINPEILQSSAEFQEYEEGCLSIPDVYADVTRPAAVRVGYLDEKGESHPRRHRGWKDSPLRIPEIPHWIAESRD